MDTIDSSFAPPHCPNPNCRYHNTLNQTWRFKKIGFYTRLTPPHRIQRFTCRHCHRSFSSQTFSTTYWLKRPDILPRLFTKTTGCMSNRQIARDLNVAPSTIDLQLARLGRHCLLFHTIFMKSANPASQIVFDGFVSFEHSQYWPFHHHLAVEKGTDFLLYFNDSEVRRSGRMSAAQKRKRRQLEARYGRPDPQAVRKDVLELLTVVTGSQPQVTLYSDDHRAYPRAIAQLKSKVRHLVTSSEARRDQRNPLFEVNLLDLLIRHCGANHKRETIAWSKRRQASAERLAVFLVWRNYMKGRREKARASPTPAQERSMCSERLTAESILAQRMFASRIDLPPRWRQYYGREVTTRALPRERRHGLAYAA